MEPNKVEYVGDAVYTMYDGYGFELFLHDGIQKSHLIYLEPDVARTLIRLLTETLDGKTNEN